MFPPVGIKVPFLANLGQLEKMLRLLMLQIVLGLVHGSVVTNLNRAIFSGEDANEGEFPFMASLRVPGKHFCGGTILTKNWVLSAAHCCERRTPSNMFINIGSLFHSHGGTNYTVKTIIWHEKYGQDYFIANDICVLRLTNPIKFNEKIQPVTLPGKNFTVNSGDVLSVAGWGWYKPQQQPDRLQKSHNFVGMTNEECQKAGHIKNFPGYICSRGGKEGQAVCFGDSGGPLLKKDVQVGITSWAKHPCRYPCPAVFARVSHYIDWIIEKLGSDAVELNISD